MPQLDLKDRLLINQFKAQMRAREEIAEELHAEEKSLRVQHPDWPLALIKATARIRLDEAIRAAKLI